LIIRKLYITLIGLFYNVCGIIFGNVTVGESLEGKVVEGIYARIDGCRIIDNVCVDYYLI